ncbi:MAG: GldG family protein [Anaerolineaceae bacterium]
MNPKLRRFAPIGLYIAAIAAMVSIGLYIVQREWNLYIQISLGCILIGLALFAILDPDKVRMALTGRQARYGSNALVLSIAFIGILVVINYLGYKNTKRWDLTEEKQNTLAKETLDTLSSLPQEVKAVAFFTGRTSSTYAKNLLEQYKFNGKGKFDYEFIDPEKDPVSAKEANVTVDGTVVVMMGDRKEPVKYVSEQELTAALVRLLNQESPKIYFLTGHGENSIDESGDESYSQVKTTLESKNYQVESLNLLATNAIPEDARVIVISGPDKPVSEKEVELLKAYMDNGGALIVMEEPTVVSDFGNSPDPLADYLKESWGITLGNDIVVDNTSQNGLLAVANSYANQSITDKLQGMVTIFWTARSVQISEEAEAEITRQSLINTSTQSWAETDLEALKNQDQEAQIKPDEGVDFMGPVPLAAVAENNTKEQRLVVFGDSDFAKDSFFSQYGNGDLIINAIDWASYQETLINLTPKNTVNRIMLPPKKYTLGLILLGSVFLLPGAFIVAGVVVWFQRRRRG